MDDLKVGKLYRLRFPGIAARVMEAPTGLERSSEYRYLVESLVLRSRWWVNSRGEPDKFYSPQLVLPFGVKRGNSFTARGLTRAFPNGDFLLTLHDP